MAKITKVPEKQARKTAKISRVLPPAYARFRAETARPTANPRKPYGYNCWVRPQRQSVTLTVTGGNQRLDLCMVAKLRPGCKLINREFVIDGDPVATVRLQEFRDRLRRIIDKHILLNQAPSLQEIKAEFLSEVGDVRASVPTLLQAAQMFYHDRHEKTPTRTRKQTKKCERYRLGTLTGFVHDYLKRTDLPLSSIRPTVVDDLTDYYRNALDYKVNSSNRCLKTVNGLLAYCVRNGWMKVNPMAGFRAKEEFTPRPALTVAEIDALRALDLSYSPELELHRDIFLFQLASCQAHCDLERLRPEDLRFTATGQPYILQPRQKTGVTAVAALDEEAMSIVAKYRQHPRCRDGKRLLPVPSGVDRNRVLKSLATMIGLQKTLTTHVARVSGATRLLNDHGASMDSLAAHLGHSSPAITRKAYARFDPETVVQHVSQARKSTTLNAA